MMSQTLPFQGKGMSGWWPLAALLASGAVFGTAGFLTALNFMPSRAEVEACDRVVATLLSTRDPIELQRAGILVQGIRCNIGRRLVTQSASHP
jgi:hypothetical protein